jgi:hypothetical protein
LVRGVAVAFDAFPKDASVCASPLWKRIAMLALLERAEDELDWDSDLAL